jgi:hypothetical protein
MMEVRQYFAVFSLVVLATFLPEASATQTTGLRIVVIEGEDGVNVIQQKSAVAPVVEVRDRNDQPVAGAVVTFTVRRGRASFNGARNLTTTDQSSGWVRQTNYRGSDADGHQLTVTGPQVTLLAR